MFKKDDSGQPLESTSGLNTKEGGMETMYFAGGRSCSDSDSGHVVFIFTLKSP